MERWFAKQNEEIQMKTISVIGITGIPAQYGGFETLVENLVENQTTKIQYIIYCSSKILVKGPRIYKNSILKYIYINANGPLSIIYDLVCMINSIQTDIMLILGVSGCIFLPIIRLFFKGKIIVNIDGMEWKRDKWSIFAKYFLKLSEKVAVQNADVIIGDNQGIVDYINCEYNKKAYLIEYGSDHAKRIDIENDNTFNLTNYAITVCRIEPENNIHLLLECFSKVVKYNFLIVGNWKNSKYGRNLYDNYKNFDNIFLMNPIYDIFKLNYLRSHAKIYIHGHSAGGTNPSLVEAMNLSLPVFAYKCIYNIYTTENKCIYWKSKDELLLSLNTVNDIDLHKIGLRMNSIAVKRYQWSIIANKYEQLYFYH